MVAEPTFFPTEGDFRCWLAANHATASELLVGFWKKGSGQPSIDWPRARDQALCFGWIDGVRKSLGDEAYTIRFTPRRKGSVWSKVNVARFEALKAAEQMTAAGEAAFEAGKDNRSRYAYESEVRELEAVEISRFKAVPGAWADWEKRPPGYRKVVTHWVTSAKKPETRAKRLGILIESSAAGEKIPGYDIGQKKEKR